jgi:L-iditol 2-dehydrogenase
MTPGIVGQEYEHGAVAFFDVHRTCGRCLACTVHRTPTRCPSRRVYGITDPAAEGLFGGWAQKVYLEPGVIVAKLPDSVTFEAYIGGGCGLLTSVHIIERSRIVLGDTVVVQGAGAVGMSTAALAKQSGAGQVIVIGAPADRLALALDTLTIHPSPCATMPGMTACASSSGACMLTSNMMRWRL